MKIAVGDPFSLSFRIAGDPKPKRKLDSPPLMWSNF